MTLNKCNTCGSDNAANAKYCSECGYELPKSNSNKEQQDIPPAPGKKEKKSNNKTAGFLVGVLVFFIVSMTIQQLFLETPAYDKVIMHTASELNKTCPIMVDSETRLDNALALPNKIFQYNYTLVNLDRLDIDTIEVKKNLEPSVTNHIRTNPDMKYYRDNKITMRYYYKDKNGNYVFSFSVTPEQYK